eukprot:jgi/Picsp_1/3859/NSC_01371-R1_---NA---
MKKVEQHLLNGAGRRLLSILVVLMVSLPKEAECISRLEKARNSLFDIIEDDIPSCNLNALKDPSVIIQNLECGSDRSFLSDVEGQEDACPPSCVRYIKAIGGPECMDEEDREKIKLYERLIADFEQGQLPSNRKDLDFFLTHYSLDLEAFAGVVVTEAQLLSLFNSWSQEELQESVLNDWIMRCEDEIAYYKSNEVLQKVCAANENEQSVRKRLVSSDIQTLSSYIDTMQKLPRSSFPRL